MTAFVARAASEGLPALKQERAVVGYVSGRVQGVGFRWHVREAALRYDVRGDVRNLPDGRVEFRARGAPANVEKLIDSIRQGPPGARVDDVEMREWDAPAELSGFQVRF